MTILKIVLKNALFALIIGGLMIHMLGFIFGTVVAAFVFATLFANAIFEIIDHRTKPRDLLK